MMRTYSGVETVRLNQNAFTPRESDFKDIGFGRFPNSALVGGKASIQFSESPQRITVNPRPQDRVVGTG